VAAQPTRLTSRTPPSTAPVVFNIQPSGETVAMAVRGSAIVGTAESLVWRHIIASVVSREPWWPVTLSATSFRIVEDHGGVVSQGKANLRRGSPNNGLWCRALHTPTGAAGKEVDEESRRGELAPTRNEGAYPTVCHSILLTGLLGSPEPCQWPSPEPPLLTQDRRAIP
jgi:hypothetical protein